MKEEGGGRVGTGKKRIIVSDVARYHVLVKSFVTFRSPAESVNFTQQ